jgi:subtilisin family serine protease
VDPALRELLRRGADEDEVEAVIRLADDVVAPPPGVRIVARFGAIATCRLRRREIPRVWADDVVASLKAPRLIAPEADTLDLDEVEPRPGDARRPSGGPRGHGTVIGVLDWGLDVVRDSFRTPAGGTRVAALWDQRAHRGRPQANLYGYGTVHTREVIDAALRSRDPYAALGYHPADADPLMTGAHGTVVVDLAAGNGRSGGPTGVAPEAEIVFVHLSSRGTGGLATLGDSIGILEGIDFIRRVAAGRPTALSMSVGRHGGPHDGSTLVEGAIDAFLAGGRGLGKTLSQSAGNYRVKQVHASGVLSPGATRRLRLVVDALDPSLNELEIWHDTAPCAVRLDAPDGTSSGWVPLGATVDLVRAGRLLGRVYHRDSDPQNGSHHVDAFIYPGAPGGEWAVWLRDDRDEGPAQRFHAWIERDDACPHCQSRFRVEDADSSCTLGTLATGRHALVCGAFDAQDGSAAAFSSMGPTRDGRPKPDLSGPGVGVLALRSQPRGNGPFAPFVRKSGTSMVAPQVAGTAALLLEVTAGRLSNDDVRDILLSTADPIGQADPEGRLGAGYLNIDRAIDAALRHVGCRDAARRGAGGPARRRPPRQEESMADHAELQALLDGSIDAGRVFRSVARGAPLDNLHVLATPGEAPVTPIRGGDVIVRVALGEPGLGHVAVLVDGQLGDAEELSAAGFTLESREPGLYGHVLEDGAFPHAPGARFARRVLETSGRVPPGQVLLRPAVRGLDLGASAAAPLAESLEPVESETVTSFGPDESTATSMAPAPSVLDETPAYPTPEVTSDPAEEEYQGVDQFAEVDPVAATIGFEFDLNIGVQSDVFAARASDMPAGSTLPLDGDKLTDHKERDGSGAVLDGFETKVDGPRLEIATTSIDIDDDGAFAKVVRNVVAFARELETARGRVGADAGITVPGIAGHPVRFTHPRAKITGLPLVVHPRGPQDALKWPSDATVWAAPQATITIPLARVGELIDAIAASAGKAKGTALSGAASERLGVRSDLVVLAKERVLKNREWKIGTALPDGTTVREADFSPTLTGLLILMTSYLLVGEYVDVRDYELFAKAYLAINVKAPFRDLFREALSAREQLVFKKLYAESRADFFRLGHNGACDADENNQLFPTRVRCPDLDRFHTTRLTWRMLLDNTVNDVPLKVTRANSVRKKHHALGDEVLWAPISKIIPFASTKPRVALELRRIGFAAHGVGTWESLMKTVRALAKRQNR